MIDKLVWRSGVLASMTSAESFQGYTRLRLEIARFLLDAAG